MSNNSQEELRSSVGYSIYGCWLDHSYKWQCINFPSVKDADHYLLDRDHKKEFPITRIVPVPSLVPNIMKGYYLKHKLCPPVHVRTYFSDALENNTIKAYTLKDE